MGGQLKSAATLISSPSCVSWTNGINADETTYGDVRLIPEVTEDMPELEEADAIIGNRAVPLMPNIKG